MDALAADHGVDIDRGGGNDDRTCARRAGQAQRRPRYVTRRQSLHGGYVDAGHAAHGDPAQRARPRPHSRH